jgi:hypothetical protein
MQSLPKILKKEWLLLLVESIFNVCRQQFGISSGRNITGFENPYNDEDYHNNDYDKIEEIFKVTLIFT